MPDLSTTEHLHAAQAARASQPFDGADTATLLLALAEITRDAAVLDRWSERVRGPTPEATDFTADDRRDIGQRLENALRRHPDAAPYAFDNPVLNEKLFAAAAGRPVPPLEQQLLLKEMGVGAEVHVDWSGGRRPDAATDFPVAIVGAGLSGIAMAVRLKRLGIPFTIYDSLADVGGTWLQNDYPGCGVDIASHYFSYSFEPSPEWTRYYAKQPEILAYLRACVDKYGLREHLELCTRVVASRYDEPTATWTLDTEGSSGRGTRTVKAVVVGVGQLSVPRTPAYPGLDKFRGRHCHSAQWDPAMVIDGQRVVLVGGGASANQIGPAIADRVNQLTVLQRSPHWMMGVPRYQEFVPEAARRALREIPAYQRWFRARSLLSMNDVVRPAALIDPNWQGPAGTINAESERIRRLLTDYIRSELPGREDLVERVTPAYPPFLKRMLRDNGWYRMLARPNVELVASNISHFVEDGIVDQQGRFIPADEVVFATGFAAADMLATVDLEGRGGRRLRHAWADENPRAFLGMAVPAFPNTFVLYGPNTNIGTGGSIFFQAEVQSSYIAQLLAAMLEGGLTTVEVREDVHDDYNQRLDARLQQMVWSLPSADTWCRNKHGRVTANMPWSSLEYWHMVRHPDLNHYNPSKA